VDHQLQGKEIQAELGMVMLELVGVVLAEGAVALVLLEEMHQDQP